MKTHSIKQRIYGALIERKGWIPLIFLFLLLLILVLLPHLSVIVIIAFFLAYTIQPWVTVLHLKARIPRTIATAFSLIILLWVVTLIIMIIIPSLSQQISIAVTKLPHLYERLDTLILRIARNIGMENNVSSLNELMSGAANNFSSVATPIASGVSKAVTLLFKQTFSLASFLFNIIIIVVVAFVTSVHFPHVKQQLYELTPPRFHRSEHEWITKFNTILSGFIRGQLIVAVVLGSFYAIGFSIAGIGWPISLGVMVGSLCLVPYAGIFTGFIVALLLAGAQSGFDGIISVIIVFAIIQTMDTLFITPNIMGKKVGIHPVFVILALYAGGELAGLLGVLVAVPVFALLKLVVEHVVELYKVSAFYREELDDGNTEEIADESNS